MNERRNIRLEGNGYSVFIGDIFSELNNWLREKNYSSLFILVDNNTRKHCLPLIQQKVTALSDTTIIEIKSGESFKTIQGAEFIWQKLIEREADKKSLLINLGGGVITDLGGFAAATYKRGIGFINVPTTLLGMVDASIGGKTGVDFDNIKNAIGLIKNPEAVFIHPAFLQTLAQEQLLSGYAEMVKHSLIEGEGISPLPLHKGTWGTSGTNAIIAESVEVKLSIVNKDPEEKNVRKQLNFGHTVGHALESWLLEIQHPPLHGICVAAGMIVALYLSEGLAGLDRNYKEEIIKHIKNLFPPILFTESDVDEIIRLMKQDKKNTSGEIRFVLMQQPGVMLVDQLVSEDEIKDALKFYSGFIS